ncbi:TonB-dependent receptor [Paraneptunicella aestuarii]|uniref:TonB-dependent receptor n=1 Tax=Paraneptunicella aestuarii TaxID=2831148 RepID=UPI001E2BD2A0|nr:TonB-dependent receptor [Paraneptunicella aestuarii]UAA39967.1 TonB-dependent receptor [Paraneptunicella aestuarii]
MKKRFLTLSILTTFSVVTATHSVAEDAESIETITVTSDFRDKPIDEISSSVSVLSENVLNQRQAKHLEELLNVAPNLNFNSGAGRGRFIQIRGIGERSQYAEPINPSVGFIIDDMDFSGMAGIGTLFDVEQVEVLRGPHGTEFGASAMAGVVKLKTVDPSALASGHFRLSVAQQDTWELAAAYGDSLSDKWQYRVAVQQYASDGFIKNIYLDREDTDNIDELTSRIKLRYLATENLTLDFSYQYFDIDNGYDAFSLDNDGKTRSDEPGFDRQETHAFGLNAQWRQPWGTVKAIYTNNQSDLEYGYDEDWTYVGFHPWEYSSTDHYFRNRDNNSLDVRVVSNDSSKLLAGSTSWVIGAYLKNVDEDVVREYTYAEGRPANDYQVDTLALYGQLDSQLSEQLTLITGLRVESTETDYQDSAGFAETSDDTIVGGKLVLEYQSEQSGLLYGGVYRGYKLGGFNTDLRIAPEYRLFEPEYNWNYEIGMKNRFLNDKLYMGISAFYMERKNNQIDDYFILEIPGTGALSFVDVKLNADVGTNKGVEIESRYELNNSATFFANIGLLDATFGDLYNAKGEYVPEREQAQAPSYTFNVGMVIDVTEHLRMSLEADGKDEHYFSDGHNERSSAYVLWHTRFVYQMNDWEWSIWGKNIFDKRYYVRGFGGFNNDPREYYEGEKPYYQLGDGRQFGLSVDYHF